MMRAPKVRPCRIRVAHSASARDLFTISVGPLADGDRPEAHATEWADGWFHTWVSLPDLLDDPGPYVLSVEECAVPLPPELARDPEVHGVLMRPTFVRDELDLGKLGGLVLRYLKKSRDALAA